MIRSFVWKIQKSLLDIVHRRASLSHFNEVKRSVVAEDVGEGYFAVVAMNGGETKRFIVGLDYLTDPAFLGLLDQAQEEYGFKQKGTLSVPCQPQELQKILDAARV